MSHTSKALLKSIQHRMESELSVERVCFWRGKGTRDHIANLGWMETSQRAPRLSILMFLRLGKAFKCVDHNLNWNRLSELGMLEHLISHMRDLYAGK